MITGLELAWAAGFLEGEGTFRCRNSDGAKKRGGIHLSAPQVQKEPLERLQSLFGGALYFRDKRVRYGRPTQSVWTWGLFGSAAAGLMMSLYVFMSPERRQRIRAALATWRRQPLCHRDRTHCIRGHSFSGHNLIVSKRGRICRECQRLRGAQALSRFLVQHGYRRQMDYRLTLEQRAEARA